MAEAFTWGAGGERVTSAERRRRIAEAMMKAGSDTSPVQHWTQGAARVAQALLGGWQAGAADTAEKAAEAKVAADASLMGMPGATAPAASPVTASASTADPSVAVAATPAALAPVFTTKEAQYNLPQNYLPQVAKIESGFNPNAANPNSSARGLFQFTKGTARDYALANPMDPIASTDAAARLAADNAKTLTRALGRAPTAGELYLAHQQGGGGASKLLANPSARAIDVVGRDAVINNGGNADMTAAEFARRWTNKVAANEADLPAQDAAVAEAPGAAPGFVIPPAAASAPAMDGATFNAIANGVDQAPLDPVFQTEGISQPWMGTALAPAATAAPQVARAPMPPPRPADLPALGAVEAIGQAPVAAAPAAVPPAPIIADPTKDNAGVLSGLVASEEARKGLPSGAGIMSPFGGAAVPAASPAAANDQSVFSRIASALGGGSAAPAPAAVPSPAVQAVAAALPAQAASAPAAAPSAGTERVAAAMRVLNSPYAQPGQRAVASMIVQQAFKDPTEAELKRLTVEKARREAENAPLDAEGKRLDIEGKKKALGKAEAPTVQRIKQPDGSEVAVQWDQGKKAWVPLEAPQGGNAVGGSASNPYALPGKPTESQSKDAGFASRMVESHNQITGLESVGTDKKQAMAGSIPYIGNQLSSPDKQKFEQAKRNFVTAILRKESGAAISSGEFETEEKKYFPQVGDSADVIKQKRDARELAIEGVMAGAGSGYKVPDSYKPQRSQTVDTSKPGSFKFNPATGKMEPM